MDDKQLQTIEGLLQVQIEELKKHTADAIKHNVNGKIDAINMKLTSYIHEDEKWKERAEPLIKTYEDTNGAYRVLVWFLKFLGLTTAASGAILLVKQIFK